MYTHGQETFQVVLSLGDTVTRYTYATEDKALDALAALEDVGALDAYDVVEIHAKRTVFTQASERVAVAA